MEIEHFLGIDVGGTKIYGVVTDSEHNILSEAKMNTPVDVQPEELAKAIADFGQELLDPYGEKLASAGCIGIAVPASVNPVTGDCLHAPNLGLKNFSLKSELERLCGQHVFLGNDGNCGVVAEHACGAAREFDNVIGYYIGTGLGGGILVNGKLYTGTSGLAGEVGHTIIKKGGRKCTCGHRGCIEAYCSKKAFLKAMKKAVFKRGLKTLLPEDKFNKDTRNIKSKHLAKAYLGGDMALCSVIQDGCRMLGAAIASHVALVAPQCVVLGGGVISALGEEMLPFIEESFAKHVFGIGPESVSIRLSVLGDAAIALGATILAAESLAGK